MRPHFTRIPPCSNLAVRPGRKVSVAVCFAVVFLFSEAVFVSNPSSSLASNSSKSNDNVHSAPAGLTSLPPAAQSGISAKLGRDLPGYQARAWRGRVEVANAPHKLAVDFTAQGLELRRGSQLWKIALSGYGHGDDLRIVRPAAPRADGNRVEYRRGALTEWYVNGPLGLEQGITLHKRTGKAQGQPLVVALAMEGSLKASVDDNQTGLTLTSGEGQAVLHYGGLSAYDASGRKLPAWLEVKGSRLLLKADDTNARYPVVVDPFVQEAELTASDGIANQEMGASVAVSGNVVVAGAPGCLSCGFTGVAYVFVEGTSGWANMTQTAELTASDGAVNNQFGFAVSISGETIVVGSHGTDGGQGAAYVFVEPATGWTNMTETAKLTASNGKPGQLLGRSVSISGNTVVAGAPGVSLANREQGAAYVFVEPASGWASMTQTAELTASNGVAYQEMGYSVGIDGNTVVAGAPSPIGDENTTPGAAYVFVEPATGWASMTQTAELTGSDTVNGDRLGNFVAISGGTVVAGAPLDTPGSFLQQGAAYVFVEPASGWASMTQTAKLTSSDGTARSYFGRGVAISGDEVVVGAPNQTVDGNTSEGAVYEFTEPATGWVDMTETAELDVLHAGKNDIVGTRVGVDGATIVTGAYGGNKEGAAFVFVDTD